MFCILCMWYIVAALVNSETTIIEKVSERQHIFFSASVFLRNTFAFNAGVVVKWIIITAKWIEFIVKVVKKIPYHIECVTHFMLWFPSDTFILGLRFLLCFFFHLPRTIMFPLGPSVVYFCFYLFLYLAVRFVSFSS